MRPTLTLRLLLVIACSLLLALPASAVPAKLAQQGRVLDSAGAPLEGSHEMGFALLDAASGGTELWSESRTADFDNGYYSIILGEDVPLDDLLFDSEGVWLEVVIDGEVLSPRQEVVSVPYALRAVSAANVEGGVANVGEVSIDGAVVIDSTGAWVGPAPVVALDWQDLTGVPPDLTDGDQDTLSSLACSGGQLPKWDATNSVWGCSDDDNTNTQLDETQVDAFVSNNGYTTTDSDTLAALSCAPGEIARFVGPTGGWACDAETVTTTLPWSAVTGIPGDLADGDQDTDTQLSETQVETYVTNAAINLAAGSTTGGQQPVLVDANGNVGIGTPAATERLTVAGTIESTSGGVKFPDGTVQTTAGGSGTVIYTRCAWTSTYSSGVGGCTPPMCPSGWVDLNLIGNVKTATGTGTSTSSAYQESGGYQERACFSSIPALALYSRCAWTSTYASGIGNCSPNACPSGWTDLGITGNVKTSIAVDTSTSSAYQEAGGYQERICTQ